MGFIENHVVPGLPLENVGISARQCIGRDADIEAMLVVPALAELLTSFGSAMIT